LVTGANLNGLFDNLPILIVELNSVKNLLSEEIQIHDIFNKSKEYTNPEFQINDGTATNKSKYVSEDGSYQGEIRFRINLYFYYLDLN